MSNLFTINSSSYQNNEFKWTHSANWLLINSYLEIKEEFRNPVIRKKDLWIRISDKFRDVGHEVPFDVLDKKFRNLKSTYYQVKERKEQSSNKMVKWEYYKVFDELLKGGEGAAAANENESTAPDDQHFRSSAFVPGIRKRKRVLMSSKPRFVKENTKITIEPAVGSLENDENSSDKNMEFDVLSNESEKAYEYEYEVVTENEPSKKVDLRYLEARKLHAETKYFHKKADYFERQTQNLDLQRKLMIMQAHKLKLEIDQMKNDKEI